MEGGMIFGLVGRDIFTRHNTYYINCAQIFIFNLSNAINIQMLYFYRI